MSGLWRLTWPTPRPWTRPQNTSSESSGSLVPWYVDRYLARFGYDAQQTDDPVAANRPNNLFAPVPHDHGAHGRFDAHARSSSVEWWMATHRGSVLAGVLALGTAAALAALWNDARDR